MGQYLLILALLVSACALPADDAGDTWAAAAEVESVSEVEMGAHEIDNPPLIDPILYFPICVDHYVCCQDTRLGDTTDAPKKSRCASCADICHDEHDGRGHWPECTYAGDDCQYWKPEYWYRTPSEKCARLPR